jgi:hypothetical protein
MSAMRINRRDFFNFDRDFYDWLQLNEKCRRSSHRRGTSGQCWPGSHLLHLPFVGVQQSGFLGQIPVSLLQMAGNPLWLTQINEFIPAAWAKARAGKVVAQAA